MPILKLYLSRDIVPTNSVWKVVDPSSRWDIKIYLLSTDRDGQIWHLLLPVNDRYPIIERYSIEQLPTDLALCPSRQHASMVLWHYGCQARQQTKHARALAAAMSSYLVVCFEVVVAGAAHFAVLIPVVRKVR